MNHWRSGAALVATALLLATPVAAKRMIVLGIDGMDPEILEELMAGGHMPHFQALAAEGGYVHLGTSVPPQSPVAWSNFITGLDSGGHGIFDFIHRDPTTMTPYLSTSKVEGGTPRSVHLGKYQLPLSAPKTVLLRQGRSFWELLEAQDVPTTIFKIPANYPPTETPGRSISGMGTPDLLGTSGSFSYFTDDPSWSAEEMDGGSVFPVTIDHGRVTTALHGPANTFLKAAAGETPPAALAPFTVDVDPEHPACLIEIGTHRELLQPGEWSGWLEVEFELVPHLVTVSGIVRFYLMGTQPHLRLYATPINLNPKAPAQPISTPPEWCETLCEEVGFFYTQGMPEDTKALTGGVFDDADFHAQADLVLQERLRLFDHVLADWAGEGLLFFYFSSVDQQCHAMWHHTDPEHPAHDPNQADVFGDALHTTYKAMDEVLAKLAPYLDDETTLLIMSDHGFAPFRRAVHLNRWLMDEGYLTLKEGVEPSDDTNIFVHVDWAKTRAYAMGLNLLYLNLQGRERRGKVPVRQRRALTEEIATKLNALTDPANGARMVTRTYFAEDTYQGPHVAEGPDLVVGYAPGYRASWQTALGGIPSVVVSDNAEKWSGDHCMDHTAVPGVLLSNRPIRHPSPELTDLTVTILSEFGIPKEAEMRGRSVFAGERASTQ